MNDFELGEVLVGFAGEADDEGRAQGDVRNARADVLEQPHVRLARARPLHALQHRVGRVLQRQVDVLHDLVEIGDRVDDVVVMVVG